MKVPKRIPVLVASLFLSIPTVAFAATISLHAVPTNVGVGDLVRVNVLLSSAAAANAFSGALSYPEMFLEPIAVYDGSSIVSLWITRPAIPATGASISFAGITPGGFSGDDGMLFSLLFRAKTAGVARVSLKDVDVLRNDGVGGKEPIALKPLKLSIGPKSLGEYAEPVDRVPPETFTAYLGNDPQVFDGRNYLIFAATDKISGMDHYAVAESRAPSFLLPYLPLRWSITSTSPYVLADQNLTSTVYIKAVDRAGNERVTIFPRRHLFTVYEKAIFLGILTAVVFLWQWVRRGRLGKNP